MRLESKVNYMKLRSVSLFGTVLAASITASVLMGCAGSEEAPANQTPRVRLAAPAVARKTIALSDEMPLEYTDAKGIHWLGERFDVNESPEAAQAWAAAKLNIDFAKFKSLAELDDAAYAEMTRPMRVVLREGQAPVRYVGSAVPVEEIARTRRIDRAGGRGYTERPGGPMRELPALGLDAKDAFTTSLRATLDPTEPAKGWNNDPSQFGVTIDPTKTLPNIIYFDGDNRTWNSGTIAYTNAASTVNVLGTLPTYPYSYVCSGTMIGWNTMVTAAHCYWDAGHSLGWPTYRFGRQHWYDQSTGIYHDVDTYGGVELGCQTLTYPAAFQAGGAYLALEELDYAVVDYYANGCYHSPAGPGTQGKAINAGYGPSYYYGAMTYVELHGYDTNDTSGVGGTVYPRSYTAGASVIDRSRTPYTNSVWVDSSDSAYPGLARHILDTVGGASGAGMIGNVLTWEGNTSSLYWLGNHVGAVNSNSTYNYMRRLDATTWYNISAWTTEW